MAAWIAGNTDEVVTAIDRAWPAAVRHPHAWELGELSWWLAVAGIRRDTLIPVARPFALMLDGAWLAAADEWQRLGCPLWTALALSASPGLTAARREVDIVDTLGAVAVRQAMLAERHSRGLPVPRGPRPASSTNPSQLTAREMEVLGLLIDGLSNAQIAARMFLSGKTLGHHVSAVLRKLGEPTRSRAVAAALGRGIIAPT